MEARRGAELDGEWKAVRRGWRLGGKEFRSNLLEQMRGRTGPNHGGEERRAGEEAWAGQVLAGQLKAQGWTAADVAQRRKGDGQKLQMARRLRQETTMSLTWIASRLSMGTAGSLANLLRHDRKRQ